MRWLQLIAAAVQLGWYFPAFMRFLGLTPAGRIGDIVRTLFWELRPFYVPAVVIGIGIRVVTGKSDPFDWFGFVCSLVFWWVAKDSKDDDDDRWKRRREKLAEKVSVVAGRLVVAPAGGAA